jgi:hypothetical protein
MSDDKVLIKWTASCQMDDFYGALKEIEAVQANKPEAGKTRPNT